MAHGWSRAFFRGRRGFTRGFTLVELVVSIAIIAIIVGTVFYYFPTFTSQSLLRVRIADLGEYIRFAQNRSGAAENFSQSAALPTQGFQVIRAKVRNGILQGFRLEKAPGAFDGFADGGVFATAQVAEVAATRQVELEPHERYFIDVCFINTDGVPQYTRAKMTVSGDAACARSSVLCTSPDPTDPNYDADKTARNNFDIHFSVEQPTREVHANTIPVKVSGSTETYTYESAEPNGASSRTSAVYEGIRVVFITEAGYKRSMDVFTTGLIGLKSNDSTAGCR